MPYLGKIIHQEGGMRRLIVAEEKDRNAWYVVELDQAHYQAYKKAMRRGDLNINDYATLLDSGWGELTEDLKRKLILQYEL